MDHITVETVLYILWHIALIEILLTGAILLTQAGHIVRRWLLTDDEPEKIEALKLKEEPKAVEEKIIEIDGIQ